MLLQLATGEPAIWVSCISGPWKSIPLVGGRRASLDVLRLGPSGRAGGRPGEASQWALVRTLGGGKGPLPTSLTIALEAGRRKPEFLHTHTPQLAMEGLKLYKLFFLEIDPAK